MLKRIITSVLLAGLIAAARGQAPVTLRSLGAVGDGKTDDRAAIEAALNDAQGALVDGEGLTYAVHGNIDITAAVDFRNAKLVQTMGPADTAKFFAGGRGTGTINVEPAAALRTTLKGMPVMLPDGVGTYAEDPVPSEAELKALLPGIALGTLTIRGDEGQPVSVTLEQVHVDRGKHPQSGGRNDGWGIALSYASPVQIRDVEITGDGKGTGLKVDYCSKVKIERIKIHDMQWAPYDGDNVLERLTAAEVRDDVGWNNFPIYEYRAGMKRFVRVRVQEQLVGMFLSSSNDIEVVDSKVEGLQTKIGDKLYPLQSDGMTINRVKNITVRNSQFRKCWEGIDFTGGGGSDFVFENCTVSDTLAWAFKVAHPKQNGKMINCTAVRAGAGFVIGYGADNMLLSNCKALETGANQYCTRPDGSHIMEIFGFCIENTLKDFATPRKIKLEHCSAINKEHPGAMDYGLFCQVNPAGREISVTDFTSVGAKIKDIEGIAQGPAIPGAAPAAGAQ